VIHFQINQIVGSFLSIIFSKITICDFLLLHFHTSKIKFNQYFFKSFELKIFTFVFLNFVFFTNSAKLSGKRSFAGIVVKSLAKIIFSIVFSLSFAIFSQSLLTIKLILSGFFSVLYSSYLYLANIELFNNISIFFKEFGKIVRLEGNFLNSSHKK
jgi:hypothetical protein